MDKNQNMDRKQINIAEREALKAQGKEVNKYGEEITAEHKEKYWAVHPVTGKEVSMHWDDWNFDYGYWAYRMGR